MPLTYRTIWISDVHLGNPACRADDLYRFLQQVEADNLFLVGDIVDLERMKVDATNVVFIPGNHDHDLRKMTGRRIFGIPIENEAVHETLDGRRFLVMHGDALDAEVRRGTNLDAFGAAAYALMLRLDVLVNDFRHRMGHDHLSISSKIKTRIARAQAYISRFEQVAAGYASRRGFDGIVCGHIHRPRVCEIDGVTYANDGDWVEHRTALAERKDGSLELLSFGRDAIGVESFDSLSPLAA